MPEDLKVDDDLETGNAPEEGERWSFDENVAASFEDMLERSIPNYEHMRRFVTDAVVYHTRRMATGGRQPRIVDLGASRGSALEPLIDKIGARARYNAVEISPPMLQALQDRFSGWIEQDLMTVHDHDLREGYPPGAAPASTVMSILCLQFTPIEYRQQILSGIYDALVPGGLFVLVEKVLGADAAIQDLMVETYHDFKEQSGYSRDAIDRKRLALEGVLVPLTARFNEEMVREAGFAAVDCGWAWGSFRGYLAVKR